MAQGLVVVSDGEQCIDILFDESKGGFVAWISGSELPPDTRQGEPQAHARPIRRSQSATWLLVVLDAPTRAELLLGQAEGARHLSRRAARLESAMHGEEGPISRRRVVGHQRGKAVDACRSPQGHRHVDSLHRQGGIAEGATGRTSPRARHIVERAIRIKTAQYLNAVDEDYQQPAATLQ